MHTRIFFAGFALPILCIASLHAVLDTRGVLRGTPSIQGVNSRMSTAYSILHSKPNGLVLGTSADFPISLAHPGWRAESAPRIHANTSGARFYENVRTFQHSVAIHPPKQVVFGLFFNFAHVQLRTDTDFAEARLRVYPDGRKAPFSLWVLHLLPDIHYALFSGDIYEDVFQNVRKRHSLSFIRENRNKPMRKRKRIEPLPEFLKSFDHNDDTLCDGENFLQKQDVSLAQFRSTVALAREHNIDMNFFLTPIHARTFSLLQKNECWPAYRSWIRGMLSILEEDARTHPQEKPYVLWDFSGYNSITTECILPHNDNASQMRWYYNGAHFSVQTADFILDRIFDYHSPKRDVPNDFGMQLSMEMLDDYFSEMDKKMKEYVRSRPESIEQEIELSLNGDCSQ
ncbi:hypothetical protein COU78_01910 [Candidatus Peregrinibacteria bacterium CG10_big_fil_rev_8_21_14_0_10_49_24]|nr:MAG: hypothetical protein COV83_06020 [Candidatus Peregrinibacteria bacterium CG11_big_fil_rev_8_21_14_0_20_49_14]PIR51323.1 MAG: hypothetical protein COU78_01910 [Candidatus Peregrinibacteria bacterium CG10_big_fil_rev_8_21_14_0_10_49_24]PJA67428.1 MAG: hypothetical protein CO157_04760 [Candidatus Peregrinibacteria bacterium CG_4_9_14_3_um_filter_49_12]